MNGRWVNIALLMMVFGLSLSFAYYYGTQQTEDTEVEVVVPPPPATVAPTATPVSNVPAGWQIYSNTEYGFSIAYPPSYRALTDQENLYGWPNAIVLIYGGGQSYDLVIEHWDSAAEYQAKYSNQTNLTVKQVNGVYITLLNMNFEPEVDEIIETFSVN